MKSSGLFRIGRDAELRFLPDGTAVANVSLAFNFGKKGEDGNRPTQWIDGSLFGARAETLAPMLLKGSQHVFHLADLHIETYEGKNGAGHKLAGRIDDVELTDRRDQSPQQSPRPAARPDPGAYQPAQRPAAQAQRGGSGFDDFPDSDIPFATSSMFYDMTTSKQRRMNRNDY